MAIEFLTLEHIDFIHNEEIVKAGGLAGTRDTEGVSVVLMRLKLPLEVNIYFVFYLGIHI